VSLPDGWPGAKIVFFDCDSTLAAIEGIDELAARCGVDVAALTSAAMSGEIPLDQVFRKRLERIAPAPEDLEWVAERYQQTQVTGAHDVIKSLRKLRVNCQVISGGLLPAVAPFARTLGFADDEIHAVPFPLGSLPLDAAIDVACAHPLARDGGKPEIIAHVCESLGLDSDRAMLVGDGASDLEAAPGLGLFVGFGGVVTRDRVRDQSPVFLPGPSLSGAALLGAGPSRAAELEIINPDLFAAAQQQISLPS